LVLIYVDHTVVFNLGYATNKSTTTKNAGEFLAILTAMRHAGAAVRRRAYRPMEDIQSFTQSHWAVLPQRQPWLTISVENTKH
jgi:hypothetical protein